MYLSKSIVQHISENKVCSGYDQAAQGSTQSYHLNFQGQSMHNLFG